MAVLVFLNGPPASGKSTLAQRFVAQRPLALNLDVDVVRGMLGRWLEQPTEAGFAARSVALAMASAHLDAGNDVVVPQFVGLPNFIDQLAAVVDKVGAQFVEVALIMDRVTALAAFEERSRSPKTQSHRDALALTKLVDTTDPVGEMYDKYQQLIGQRAGARRVQVIRGDIDSTMEALELAVAG